jgi:hypothetical protein
MMNTLSEVLARIGEEYQKIIQEDSRYYREISLAQKAAELGFSEVKERYGNVCAIIPLKHPVRGMKVRVDGRTFVNYAQFESGIAVPNYVAGQVDLPYSAYIVKDSMICNFG